MDIAIQFLCVVSGICAGLFLVLALLKGGRDDDFDGMA